MKLLDNHRKWTMPKRKVKKKARTVSALSFVTLTHRKDTPEKTGAILHKQVGHMNLVCGQF